MRTKYLGLAVLTTVGLLANFTNLSPAVAAEDCKDVKIVFARGSGGERWNDQNYLAWKDGIENKLPTTSLTYEFVDLDYPAVGIGIDKLGVTIGALVGAGDDYEFGESIDKGVVALENMINNDSCKNTKYVIGGYSQGAMVVSKALRGLYPDKIIYAATFGDPKIYLPEGKAEMITDGKNTLHTGVTPAACRGENLSEYRAYVPDCYAYAGMLGSYRPYQPAGFEGKVGTWCNKQDIFCSSYLGISDHTSYVADNLYEDASRMIISKIASAFGVENNYVSPHDTAILIDSTGSMSGMINKYKDEALRLAEKTWEAGGRVALYDYRDIGEGYEPVEHCNFYTCTPEVFEAGLNSIVTDDGGDTEESLLHASMKVMQSLDWKLGSTKSLVILTDAGYHDPDLDKNRTTFYDVVQLSKQIDPVNFYIVTTNSTMREYEDLAWNTEGRVVSIDDGLELLTSEIMTRFDSLPRVEECDDVMNLPTLKITSAEVENGIAKLNFGATNATGVVVVVNDVITGVLGAEDVVTGELRISNLDLTQENNVNLVPINDARRGVGDSTTMQAIKIKAPNTGMGRSFER